LKNSLILLTENSSIKNLSTEKISNSKVISFDYKTHIELKKLGIKHEIVEEYFKPNDEKNIEKIVYEKFLKWHEQDWISSYLNLDDLNLGSLLDQFIGMYFLQIIKKTVCINRIIEKEKPDSIDTSNDLLKIISNISRFDQIIVKSIPGKEQNLLYYDRIQIPIKITSKSFSIWVSRKKFLYLKNFVEKLTINIFRLKPKLNRKNLSQSLLLLDFNTLLDGDFINELSSIDEEIILLNERKPAIWNIESFKKIKNSKSKILRLQDLINSQVEIEILKINKQIEKNLEKIKNMNEFETFFSYESDTIWPIIKDEFIQMCSKYFQEAVYRYKLSQILFETINIKSLLILYPNAAEERVIIHVANKFNIPGIVLQHGVPPHTKYYEKFLTLWYPAEQKHLIHAIWDKTEKKHLKTLGIEDKNFVLTGSHRLDLLFPIKNTCKSNGSILVASSTLAKQDELLDSSTFTSIEYGNMLKDICTISNNFPEKKLIVKLHPAQSPTFDAKMLIHEINESIPIFQHENILPFLEKCDVLVCMEYSTILLEAMILNKPTITSLVYSDWFEDDEMIKRGATLTVKTKEEFEIALKKILNDNEFRSNLIKKGNEFVNDFLVNQGQSVKSIKQLLKNPNQ